MNILRKIAKKRKSLIGIAAGILAALSIYFFILLKQVEIAFDSPAEFIPTRIYSSVTRIAPPMPRGFVEKKLKALGYALQVKDREIKFTLHSPHYPDYLVPENHPTLKLKDKAITLRFDSESLDSTLDSIESESGPVNEFYLEPEFVAALSSMLGWAEHVPAHLHVQGRFCMHPMVWC